LKDEGQLEILDGNSPEQSKLSSLWTELKDAIRGSEADYTEIKLGRAIFLLAVPMILELIYGIDLRSG
jgi:hypothetical protein